MSAKYDDVNNVLKIPELSIGPHRRCNGYLMEQQINDVIRCFRKGIKFNLEWKVKPLTDLDARTFVLSPDGTVPQIDEVLKQYPSGDCFFVGTKAYDIIHDLFKPRLIAEMRFNDVMGSKRADSMQYRALSKTLIFEKDKSLVDEFAVLLASFDVEDGK